jgi:excinuclease ABC subunit C
MTDMVDDILKDILYNLPEAPGVYQFFNSHNEIIYVGKAKSLKRRVSFYFQKSHYDNVKVRHLVSKISDIKYILVESESDALLLENTLIKKYKPRYNILLKDDKTYPWICVKNEPFPRVFSTRNLVKDGSSYFGPYTSVVMVRTLLELMRQLYKPRTCSLLLSQSNIFAGKFKVCLEYHIGNCKAPCVGEIGEEEYRESIMQIKDILRGNISQVIGFLRDSMRTYADNLKFEEAEAVRLRLEALEKFQNKSTVVSASIHNVDVFTIIDDDRIVVVNFMKVMNGAIIQSHNLEIVKRLDESREDILSLSIVEVRERFQSLSSEILVPFLIDDVISGVTFTCPKIGDKKKLLELSERNARYFLQERIRNAEKANPESRYGRILLAVKKDFHLTELPAHIECFDNSNIQGTNPVASCVVFKNARPSKKDYRHFNIKTVEGPNDFASMEEVIFRRYKRVLDEGSDLPQLIVIDGGKGQLHSALNSIEKLGLYGKVAIVGIAKRLEEIYFPGDSVPLYLDKQSESLKLIQQLRNEAHRFGITFHRSKRSKSMIVSVLDDIDGIGEKTKELLLNKFGSVANIKAVAPELIVELIGKKKAELLLLGLNK